MKSIEKGGKSLKNIGERKLKAAYLVILFVIISFFGWLAETLYFVVEGHGLTDRGVLSLPLCTIYGFSIIAIYLIIGTPRGGRLKPLFERARGLSRVKRVFSYVGLYFLYFVVVALIPTIVEFFTGLFFDKVFGVMLWDYSYRTLNLFGYVCLGMSVLWGILITFAMAVVWPLLERLVLCLSPKAAKCVAVTFVFLIASDFIFNIIYLLVKKRRLVLF